MNRWQMADDYSAVLLLLLLIRGLKVKRNETMKKQYFLYFEEKIYTICSFWG